MPSAPGDKVHRTRPKNPPHGARSWLHQPEAGIQILVMRLKPVTERAPQQAGVGARGSSLEHEMPPIKEVRRVTLVGLIGLEPGEWREDCRSPFPAVPQGVIGPEGAASLRKCADRGGVPPVGIEVAVPGRWSFASPGVLALDTIRRAAGEPMPLALGWKPHVLPARVG